MKLFNYYSEAGFHTSIVSTFALDFGAYESIALPRLRNAGCNNNILVADDRMLAQALMDDDRLPGNAGRLYSVIGARSPGVFHPKLTLQLGKSSGRLLVSSANMTMAGLAGNLEVVGVVTVDEKSMEAAPLLRAALDYLRRFIDPSSVTHNQVEWALKRAPWLPPTVSADAVIELQEGMRLGFLASGSPTGIGQRFVEFIGDRTVKRLVVVSPYWDHDLRTLQSLRERFSDVDTSLFIQPNAALYPGDAHPNSTAVSLFDVSKATGSDGRFAHAKVIIAETDDYDCVLFGSANCTEAALGTQGKPGINDEACLARELPAGEAVRLFGLTEALSSKTVIAITDIASFNPNHDIPLTNLDAQLPGRFELSQTQLRWWPATKLADEEVTIQLLDKNAELIAGTLTPAGSHKNPASFHYDGTYTPYFARVKSGSFISSLAVVVVKQAIHRNQQRAVSRSIAEVLDLLDDEPTEGLWLLELIQQVTAAERDMTRTVSTTEFPTRQPQARTVTAQEFSGCTLPYSKFVAGRRTANGTEVSSISLLSTTAHQSISDYLNNLIGKRSATDNHEVPEEEAPNLSLGDETADGATAMETDDLQAGEPVPSNGSPEATARDQLERRHQYIQDTQHSLKKGIEDLLINLRERAQEERLNVVDLLRIRVALMIIVGAGSNKTVIHPQDVDAQASHHPVLPFGSSPSWQDLVRRLLFDFFRVHSGTRKPLIQSLYLEADDGLGIPEDVLECWATCFWASCAMQTAISGEGVMTPISKSELELTADMYRLTCLSAQQALGATVRKVFEGMSRCYASRLGANATHIEEAHRDLVQRFCAKN